MNPSLILLSSSIVCMYIIHTFVYIFLLYICTTLTATSSDFVPHKSRFISPDFLHDAHINVLVSASNWSLYQPRLNSVLSDHDFFLMSDRWYFWIDTKNPDVPIFLHLFLLYENGGLSINSNFDKGLFTLLVIQLKSFNLIGFSFLFSFLAGYLINTLTVEIKFFYRYGRIYYSSTERKFW